MLPKCGLDLVLGATRTPGSRPGGSRNGFHSPILTDPRAERMTGPPDGYDRSAVRPVRRRGGGCGRPETAIRRPMALVSEDRGAKPLGERGRLELRDRTAPAGSNAAGSSGQSRGGGQRWANPGRSGSAVRSKPHVVRPSYGCVGTPASKLNSLTNPARCPSHPVDAVHRTLTFLRAFSRQGTPRRPPKRRSAGGPSPARETASTPPENWPVAKH